MELAVWEQPDDRTRLTRKRWAIGLYLVNMARMDKSFLKEIWFWATDTR